MSQYNIGPRIGIEGEAQFRAQISRINSEYRSMDSYLKTLDRSMAQNGKSQEALAAKGNVLRQQLALQEQRFEALSDALSKAQEKYGANSQEVMRYKGAILDVETTQAKLTRELADTEDEMRRLAEGIEDVGDSAEVAEPKMLSFGDIVKAGVASGAILNTLERVGEMIVDIGGQAIEAAADVKAANAQFEQTFGELEGRATSALESISDKTGVAVTRLQGGYTALYAFTRSVGGDQETSLNIAQRALTAAADSAAYYDRTMEDATETLQSFLKGNYANDAALGIAATETTRNAKANELYAKSFKELSEAQKVDVLLAMVEAGNAASGALGQAAREADSWTNVTGELAETWRQLLAAWGSPIVSGLTPLLAGVNEQLNLLMQPRPIQVLNAGIESFRDGIQSASSALEDSNTSMAAQAELAQRYVDRLRALEGAGLETAESQREYAQTVELLNELMPDLDLRINENTGRLEQNTWAIEQNIQALREQAEHQAKMAYYKDIQDAYTQAYKDRYAAEKALTELQVQEIDLSERLTSATAEYAAAEGDARRAAYERMLLAQADYNINISRQQDLKSSIAELNTEIDAQGALLDEATQGLADMADATASATAATDEQSEAVAALGEAYTQAKADARDSIDSQIGLFDELATKNEWSAEKILKNWEKQRDAFLKYEDNLRKAVELGLDETLIRQLSDGSQESMMILDALVNDVDISVDEINAAFGNLDDAKDEVSTAMADIQAIFDESLREMISAAGAAASDAISGFVLNLTRGQDRVYDAGYSVGRSGIRGTRDAIQSHSPSRAYMEIADDSIDGLVLQTERRTSDYVRAQRDLAQAGMVAYQEQLDHVAQYPSMMQGVPGYGTSTTTNNRSVAYGGINITINAQAGQDAHSIADAVLEELTVRLGREEAVF